MPKELPEYVCHKRVRAAKILNIVDQANLTGAVLELEDGASLLVGYNWLRKHNLTTSLKASGYVVQYEDGYLSWSPAHAFENGYTLAEKALQWAEPAELVLKMYPGDVRVTWDKEVSPFVVKLALSEVLRGNLTQFEPGGPIDFKMGGAEAPIASQVVGFAAGHVWAQPKPQATLPLTQGPALVQAVRSFLEHWSTLGGEDYVKAEVVKNLKEAYAPFAELGLEWAQPFLTQSMYEAKLVVTEPLNISAEKLAEGGQKMFDMPPVGVVPAPCGCWDDPVSGKVFGFSDPSPMPPQSAFTDNCLYIRHYCAPHWAERGGE